MTEPARDASDLIRQLGDGRAYVRASAATALAALGHPGGELVPFLRDADPSVALAAAEAIEKLGRAQLAHLVAIAAALDGARPVVVDTIVRMFTQLIGNADAELVTVLDTSSEIAADTIIRACGRAGMHGLTLLQTAARDERVRVRVNAIRGVAQLGDMDFDSSMNVLGGLERDDKISDVRAAASAGVSKLRARTRAAVVARRKTIEPTASAIAGIEQRELKTAELRAAATAAPLDELVHALESPRMFARLNAVRILALKGALAPATVRALALLLRDADDAVRLEAARVIGKVGPGAVVAATALVDALVDTDPAVSAAAESALAELGEAAAPALVAGLDTASEPRGARVAALIGKLADGPRVLRDALGSTSVDVRVHAALGLGALGKARAGAAHQALGAAAVGGNARLRAAVAVAIAMLELRPARAAPRIAIDGFDTRALTDAELAAGKAALEAAGVAGLAAHLSDAHAVVRANAAAALGSLGASALAAADALAVCLRDDAVAVRVAAARALDRIGDPAVLASAHDLVRALRDADAAFATQLATMLRTRDGRAIDDALARGLDTPDARHGQRIAELVCARPAALDLLCEAFGRASAQVHAARGLVMLGASRVGRGRALLEAARADRAPAVRELARASLRALDGAPAVPTVPAVAGFETTLLEPGAFTAADLDASALHAFAHDGRAIVRANVATALGVLGPAAVPFATTIAAMLRDDDDRVRIAAAGALDKLGDDAVIAAAPQLVAALRGDAKVAAACRAVLAARKAKVEGALLAGLETSDETHGTRIAELICALPNAHELLFIAFDGPAQNVQINAAIGIGMLGAARAGAAGRRRLVAGLAGPFTRRREAMVKALALLGGDPPR